MTLLVCALVAVCGAARSPISAGASEPHWVVTDLGNLGMAGVTVADINDRGEVVGASLTSHGATHGFVWANGSMRELGQGPFAGATGINEHGQIIGTSSSAAYSEEHAVLWEHGKMVDLGPRSGVTAINERGQILGFRYVADNGGFTSTAVLWENGTMRSLGLARAAAINDRGQVVGENGGRAVEWQKGKIIDLGPGEAVDINNRGQILGDNDGHLVVWKNGMRINLPPGTATPLAHAINERGQVTGSLRTPTGDLHAFLWQSGKLIDLGTLGGKWSTPTAISDRGQIIGYSLDKSGKQHAFLWQNGTMTQLPSPSRNTRTRAIAINEHNQIIGDNCFADCGERQPWAGSKFAVIWTSRG